MSDNFKLELPGLIGEHQAAIAGLLMDEDSRLDRRIPVLCENQLDLVARINETVAQAQPGICCIIRSPTFSGNDGAVLYFQDCIVRIRIIENVLINRAESGTRITAQYAAEQIVQTLNGKCPEGFGIALIPTQIAEIVDPRLQGVLIYEVVCKTGVCFAVAPVTPDEEENT